MIGIYRKFNEPFNKALEDTSVHFSKERNIEFRVDRLREFLEGDDVAAQEIEKFTTGEGFIDENEFALQFARFGGFYFPDESEVLPVAQDILHYFIKRFEHHLLADSN